MCKAPKAPKFKPVPPPAAPPPPPEVSAAQNQGSAVTSTDTAAEKRKRSGRSSLRIDLNTGGASAGNGLNIPQ